MTAAAKPRLSYNVAEAAEATGVSRWTIYAEIKAGRLIAHHPISRPLIAAEELQRWFEAGSTKSPRRQRRSA